MHFASSENMIPSIMRMKQSCGESGKVGACWALQMDERVRLEHCAVGVNHRDGQQREKVLMPLYPLGTEIH